MIADLITKNRSCRRFYQNHTVETQTLRDLIDLARLSASGANLQPLKYILSNASEQNARIFPSLGWAGYLKDWPGPEEGERPSGYIVILGDTRITASFGCDHGIASQSILLGAREKGLAGCIIGSIQRDRLRTILNIPDHLEILLVLAIGKPKEEAVIEDVDPDEDIRYWRDDEQVHHVPKRRLNDIIIE
jgi:nitroreductase